jgi:hypothetical protein
MLYVIVHESIPDKISWVHSDMHQELLSIPSCVAYEYNLGLNGIWSINRRFIIVENELLHNMPGTWFCPDTYVTYKVPNVCPGCKHSSFMQGNLCTFCADRCLDCLKEEADCKCGLTDF